MAEILGDAPEALSNDEIIRRYGTSALTELTKAATDPLFDWERQISISQARYQWMLVKGFTNSSLGWTQNDYGQQQAGFVPFFDQGAYQEETGADVRCAVPINFLGGDAWKFCAIMGASSPRVKAVADDLRNPDDIAAAHAADCNIRDLWTKNKIDRKWKIPAFHLYTTGPCFIRGYWNTDAGKYGQSIEPKIEVITGPDGMPMPMVVGQQAYANGDAECSFHSILEVSVPWEAKELRGNFLRLERMVDKWWLINKYPELAKYRDGNVPDDEMSGSSITASEAREAVSAPSGTAKTRKANQWRFTEWWIPQHLYEAIQSDEPRQVIQDQFSRGMYIAKVGSLTVEIDEREVCEEWTVCTVNRGEKIIERPVCADNVPIQRGINDLIGMATETVLRAITQTIVDNQLLDRQALSTREALPSEIILTALPVDGDLNKRIFQIPPAHLSDQCLPLMNLMRTMGQDISGVRPELSGGGQPTATYREAKQKKDQALAQLAPQAEAMRDSSEDLARIMVCLRSKYGSGTVKAQKKSAYGIETDVCDIAELQEAGWHAESNDDFPLTLADRRDTLYSLLHEFSPDVAQALSLLDPLNIESTLELLQVPGYESAVANQKIKTLADIDRLLQGQPIMPPPGPPGAPPGLPMPSIPPDAFDDAVLVTLIMSRWLVGPVGQKHTGTPGFFNVVARWHAYKTLATPPAPPLPPPLKGSLSIAGKLEDFPNLASEIMVGAGLPAPAPTPPVPPVGPPSMIGAPRPPIGGARPAQVNPLPSLQKGIAGPPPSPLH